MSGAPRDDEWLSAYLDGELGPAEASALEARIARDPALAAELDAAHDVVVALRGLDAVEPPPGFTARLQASLRQELGTGTVVTVSRWRRWAAVTSAAAALVAVGLVGGALLWRDGDPGAQAVRTPAVTRMDPTPVLADEAEVRKYLSERPAAERAPNRCAEAAGPGTVSRMERVVYAGEPALAFVVDRGGRSEAVLVDETTCAVRLTLAL